MSDAVTLAVLREIRDEARATRTELSAQLDEAIVRLDRVEDALVDLGERQRFGVRWLKAGARRDRKHESEVAALDARVTVLEERLPPREP